MCFENSVMFCIMYEVRLKIIKWIEEKIYIRGKLEGYEKVIFMR